MMPATILPETIAHQDGVGGFLALESSRSPWLLTLNISRILAQESLEVTVSGSPDNEHWLPLTRFPRKFYCGTYAQWLYLTDHPGVRYLRAEWTMNRWGQPDGEVLCAFSLLAEPGKVLHAGAA